MERIYEALHLSFREIWAVEKMFDYIKHLFSDFSFKAVLAKIVAIGEIILMLLFGTPLTPDGEALDLTGYELVFEDEFEGDELDLDVWEHRSEGERRGGFNASSQVSVKDGNLIIAGEYLEDGTFGEGWYTAAVRLKERYEKGYFEIRCKVNDSDGFWSAFWLQAAAPYTASVSKGGPGGAEIDIFESSCYNDKDKFCVTHAIHCAGVDGEEEGYQSCMLGKFKGNNVTEEYNTYGLKWTEDEYIFYINGVESIRSSFGNGVSQVEEEVIVSLEIPDISELDKLTKDGFKTEFVVDYVRIYQ